MSRRPGVSRSVLLVVALLLSACSPVASGSVAPTLGPAGMAAGSSGVCEAIQDLPDVTAAERVFTNVAHDALHGLAADVRVDRTSSARILETMQKVEADFQRPPDIPTLTADLEALRASADKALGEIGQGAPGCAA
jgi:hypothetical protein